MNTYASQAVGSFGASILVIIGFQPISAITGPTFPFATALGFWMLGLAMTVLGLASWYSDDYKRRVREELQRQQEQEATATDPSNPND